MPVASRTRPRRSRVPSASASTKPLVVALAADDLAGAHLDRGVGGELGAARGVEVGGRPAVVAEQAADAVGGAVALAAGVDDERAPAGAAEHERGAQPGGAAADDDAVPGRVHAPSVTRRRCDLPS